MKLSDMLFSNTKYISSANNAGQTVTVDPYQQQRLNQELSRLKPGQTLQGEVVAKNGNDVQIRINDDLVFHARLEKNMEMEPGKIVTFEVKNNGGGTLALSPLFENMGTDANVLKALDMAGLPLTNTSVAMTEAMMQEGMSIDRNSLMNMFKQVMSFPESQPASIVTLAKLGLEITPENLQQLENYKNLEHQIVKDMANVMDELSVQYESMVNSGDGKGAAALYQAVLDLVTAGGDGTAISPDGNVLVKGPEGAAPGGDTAQGISGEQVAAEQNMNATQMSENTGADTIKQTVAAENADTLLQMLKNGDEAQSGKQIMNPLGQEQQNGTAITNGNEQLQGLNQSTDATLMSILGKNELTNLTQQLQNIGLPESTLQAFADGTLTGKEALTAISKALAQLSPDVRESMSQQIFAEKGFQNLVKNALTEQWLLKPDDVQDKGKVDALYERLNSQLSKLSEALAGKVSADNPLNQNVNNLRNNLDFMNQLNQMYAYVQLPLKMTEGRAHGDLYVYANKRGLASKDGNVSALLHLDMEHLGPVDVYVAMQGQRVNTQFYLPNEEMLDFIEQHIHILNERLEKKGYSMNTVMSVKGEEKTAVEEMMDSKTMTRLSHYSFDVRA